MSDRERKLEEASERLVSLLTNYYWHEDDEELEAVNQLRRLLGWRDQLPKAQEVDLQTEEAERLSEIQRLSRQVRDLSSNLTTAQTHQEASEIRREMATISERIQRLTATLRPAPTPEGKE